MPAPKPVPNVRPSLETFLQSEHLLSPIHSVELLRFMAEKELTAGSAVMQLHWIDPEILGKKLTEVFGIPRVMADDVQSAEMKTLLPAAKVRAWQVAPISFREEGGRKKLLLGMTDPLHRAIQQSVEALTRLPIVPAFLPWPEFQKICERWPEK